MSKSEEMIRAAKNHNITIYNQKEKPLLQIPLWLVVILIFAAPQLLVVVLVTIALEYISVRYEG